MAEKINLLIDQGADFITTINLNDENGNPVDLSNYDSRAQMRKHYTSVNYINFDTSTNANGSLIMALNSSQTANIEAGRYVYDFEIIDTNNVVSRIIEGIVTVTPNVTR